MRLNSLSLLLETLQLATEFFDFLFGSVLLLLGFFQGLEHVIEVIQNTLQRGSDLLDLLDGASDRRME